MPIWSFHIYADKLLFLSRGLHTHSNVSMSLIGLEFTDFFEALKKGCPKLLYNTPSYTISISSGWYDLVFNLCKNIEKAISSLRRKNIPVILQIKSKFGGLRVYLSHSEYGISELTKEAEEKSYSICETCGESGKLINVDGYCFVGCLDHSKDK